MKQRPSRRGRGRRGRGLAFGVGDAGLFWARVERGGRLKTAAGLLKRQGRRGYRCVSGRRSAAPTGPLRAPLRKRQNTQSSGLDRCAPTGPAAPYSTPRSDRQRLRPAPWTAASGLYVGSKRRLAGSHWNASTQRTDDRHFGTSLSCTHVSRSSPPRAPCPRFRGHPTQGKKVTFLVTFLPKVLTAHGPLRGSSARCDCRIGPHGPPRFP